MCLVLFSALWQTELWLTCSVWFGQNSKTPLRPLGSNRPVEWLSVTFRNTKSTFNLMLLKIQSLCTRTTKSNPNLVDASHSYLVANSKWQVWQRGRSFCCYLRPLLTHRAGWILYRPFYQVLSSTTASRHRAMAHNGFFTMILFSYSFLPYSMHIHEVHLYVHMYYC